MKDGIYKVIVNVDGVPTEATAAVENGVFKGLGRLSGIAGFFSTGPAPSADADDMMDDEGKLADA